MEPGKSAQTYKQKTRTPALCIKSLYSLNLIQWCSSFFFNFLDQLDFFWQKGVEMNCLIERIVVYHSNYVLFSKKYLMVDSKNFNSLFWRDRRLIFDNLAHLVASQKTFFKIAENPIFQYFHQKLKTYMGKENVVQKKQSNWLIME